MAKETVFTPPTITRWKPDFRYQEKKFCEAPLENFSSKDKSLTDKEAYRVTLASLRGTLASGLGSLTTGSYSIPAGKEYDPRFDFSFLNRPDLTIVDLDEAITKMRKTLEAYDEDLSVEIKAQLAEAEKKLETMKADEVVKSSSKSEE